MASLGSRRPLFSFSGENLLQNGLGCLNSKTRLYFYSLSFFLDTMSTEPLFRKKVLKVLDNAENVGLEKNY